MFGFLGKKSNKNEAPADDLKLNVLHRNDGGGWLGEAGVFSPEGGANEMVLNAPGVIEETVSLATSSVNSEMAVGDDKQPVTAIVADDNKPASDDQTEPVVDEPKSDEQAAPTSAPMPTPEPAETAEVPDVEPAPAVESTSVPAVEPAPTPVPAEAPEESKLTPVATEAPDSPLETEKQAQPEPVAEPVKPLGADENTKLDATQGTIPQDVATTTPSIDIDKLNQLTQDQMAQRPEQPNAVTNGSNPPDPTVQNAAKQEAEHVEQPQDSGDPLEKLFNLVKGADGGLDTVKAKKLIVILKHKLSNEYLTAFVNECRKRNMADGKIIEALLKFDKLAEDGVVTNKFFEKIKK